MGSIKNKIKYMKGLDGSLTINSKLLTKDNYLIFEQNIYLEPQEVKEMMGVLK